jgi:predicted DNA-binding transcriptional regulator AlpA
MSTDREERHRAATARYRATVVENRIRVNVARLAEAMTTDFDERMRYSDEHNTAEPYTLDRLISYLRQDADGDYDNGAGLYIPSGEIYEDVCRGVLDALDGMGLDTLDLRAAIVSPISLRDALEPGRPAPRIVLDILPVGLAEIAARLGVTRQTADNWRTRGVLPEQRWTVGGRPAWAWSDIEAWAKETGRLGSDG